MQGSGRQVCLNSNTSTAPMWALLACLWWTSQSQATGLPARSSLRSWWWPAIGCRAMGPKASFGSRYGASIGVPPRNVLERSLDVQVSRPQDLLPRPAEAQTRQAGAVQTHAAAE